MMYSLYVGGKFPGIGDNGVFVVSFVNNDNNFPFEIKVVTCINSCRYYKRTTKEIKTVTK
jgi:hypothetical protein